MGFIEEFLGPVPVPKVVKVRQAFDRPRLDDPAGDLMAAITARGVLDAVRPAMKVAIAVGSRGISNEVLFVKRTVAALKARGAEPFLVPAMGSHAGATGEGQRRMLEGMGFGQECIGAPIRSSMETVRIGTSENGLPVHIDRNAHEADAIVIINRIKPHVAFRGKYESGLMKMITIGLGKQKQADICHNLGMGNMVVNIPAVARVTIAKENILFAVGILENAYHETCRIEVLRKEEIEAAEPALQEESKRLSARLHFDAMDVVVIDDIGKNISGTGFDTNVIGRYHTPYCSGGPQIARLVILNITEQSHGNGNGLGLADFTTRRVFDKFSFENTYPNALTTTVPLSVKIPMVLGSDSLAIRAAIRTSNVVDKEKVRLVRIKDTNSLDRIEVSEGMLAEVRQSAYMQIEGEPYAPAFDEHGNLF